jgi:Flp pilus assembly protein protease CpaA
MKRNELEHSDFATYGVAFIALVATVVVCFFLFNR